MAGPLENDEQDKPLDPAVERVRRKLVRFVAINLGLLFLALMAVVVAIVYRAGSIEDPPALAVPDLPSSADGSLVQGDIPLPGGARVADHALSGNRLSLHVVLPGGGRAIFVYDIAAARMVGRFDIADGE